MQPPPLPHTYITVKSKCHSPEQAGRLCSKAGHSCCRKIVSFRTLPMRKRWRLAARAVETLTKRYTETFECWALKDAATLLQRKWAHVLTFASGIARDH